MVPLSTQSKSFSSESTLRAQGRGGATQMYHDIKGIYWWDGMKKDIAETTYSIEDYAKLYIREIVRIHGVPISIISDRGVQFTVNFWKSFQKGLGTQISFSTTFHPQTDSQAIHTIQTLEDMLQACVMDFRGSGDDHLPPIEFAYNNSYYSTIQMAPYEALYRLKFEKIKLIKERLLAAQSRHKSYVDNRRRDLEFQVTEQLSYEEAPIAILDRQVRRLRTNDVDSVEVLWIDNNMEEMTWEAEEEMKTGYPQFFSTSGGGSD
ncbi:uncharacterized protein [Nicotiana tomentosiformis]|uniref:uncharacterized protein n=1 Tax=Nicotiana tomentosiformis TaxID=4098 RepID=UPI00388C64D6